MSTVKKLALAYAEALVEYHALQKHCLTSELRQDHYALREAIDTMHDAQSALDAECVRLADEKY